MSRENDYYNTLLEINSLCGKSLKENVNYNYAIIGILNKTIFDRNNEFRKCPDNALDKQVDGDHYKNMIIQPVEFCQKNGLDFCESSVIKYVSRWRDKNGIADLEKAKHFIEMLIEMENG